MSIGIRCIARWGGVTCRYTEAIGRLLVSTHPQVWHGIGLWGDIERHRRQVIQLKPRTERPVDLPARATTHTRRRHSIG